MPWCCQYCFIILSLWQIGSFDDLMFFRIFFPFGKSFMQSVKNSCLENGLGHNVMAMSRFLEVLQRILIISFIISSIAPMSHWELCMSMTSGEAQHVPHCNFINNLKM